MKKSKHKHEWRIYLERENCRRCIKCGKKEKREIGLKPDIIIKDELKT